MNKSGKQSNGNNAITKHSSVHSIKKSLKKKNNKKKTLLLNTKRKFSNNNNNAKRQLNIVADSADSLFLNTGLADHSANADEAFQKQYFGGGQGIKFIHPHHHTRIEEDPSTPPTSGGPTRADLMEHFEGLPEPEYEDGEKPWNNRKRAYIKPHDFENVKPFYVDRPKRRMHDPLPSSAPGVRQHTAYYEKFRHDPMYNIEKEVSGFNRWYEGESVMNPANGLTRDFLTKRYMRDPNSGEATLPKAFDGVIDYDELQSVLQKADHYFFEDRPAPVAQMLVPLRDPRTILPGSPLSNLVTNLEKKNKVGLPYSLDADSRAKIERALKETSLPRLKTDADLMEYMQGQVNKMYENPQDPHKEYIDTLNSQDQRVPDMSLTNGQYWTAQMRRAEFWRKYLEIFTYVDLLHTTTVRCTRAVGRVDSAAALVVMGNGRGIFTYGRGKASVREQAVRIALLKTRRNVLFTPLHENRAPYYSITGKFKASTIVLIPHPRGVGLRAGRLTFALLETMGYKDASAKLRGRPNIWNIVRAWMECIKYQESYREIAQMRGAHYQQMMNPWTKSPPIPSREEIQELEDIAAQAFKEAVIDIFRSRQLFETDTFKPLIPHLTQRANWIEKWDRYLDMANVPQSVRLYPGFSEYLDASKLVQEKKWRDEIHSDLEDAWSPTETEEYGEEFGHDNTTGGGINVHQSRNDPQRFRTSRDDQPYYEFYKPVEKPTFNRKAMRFTALNNHIQELATEAYSSAVGKTLPTAAFVQPTTNAETAHFEFLNANNKL